MRGYSRTWLGCVVGIALAVAVPQSADSVGFCRDPDKCGKPEQKCDQAALAKAKQDYERKKKTALELYDASEKTADESTKDLNEWLKQFWEGTKEATAIKTPIVGGLKFFKKLMLFRIDEVFMELKAARTALAGQAGLAVETLEIGGLIILLEQERQVAVLLHQGYQGLEEARKQMEAANKLYDEAVVALDQALKLQRDCDEAQRIVKATKSLDDKARDLRESWENNGVLYKDPSTGELYDAAGALQRAKQILSGSSGGIKQLPSVALASTSVGPSEKRTVTLAQLDQAIAELERARSTFSQGIDIAIRWCEERERLLQRLDGLKHDIAALTLA